MSTFSTNIRQNYKFIPRNSYITTYFSILRKIIIILKCKYRIIQTINDKPYSNNNYRTKNEVHT